MERERKRERWHATQTQKLNNEDKFVGDLKVNVAKHKRLLYY